MKGRTGYLWLYVFIHAPLQYIWLSTPNCLHTVTQQRWYLISFDLLRCKRAAMQKMNFIFLQMTKSGLSSYLSQRGSGATCGVNQPAVNSKRVLFYNVWAPVWGTCVSVRLTLDGSVPASALMWRMWAEVFVFNVVICYMISIWLKNSDSHSRRTKTVVFAWDIIHFQMSNRWKMLPVWSWLPFCCSATVVCAPASACVAASEGTKSQHPPRFKRGSLFTP